LAWLPLLALLIQACGGDAAPPPPPPSGQAPRTSKRAAAAASATSPGAPPVYVTNPKWTALSPFFERFGQEPETAKRDPFRNYITAHVAMPVIPEEQAESIAQVDPAAPTAETTEPEEVPEAPKSPLQRYGVDEYRLLMIVSGTAVPKAVIEDPIGNTWVVQRDTPIGNKGGVVESITQYALVVREPDRDSLVEKTLRPPIFERANELAPQLDNDIFGAERLSGPPL
jgi:Tfp pilus assembly protein PilP